MILLAVLTKTCIKNFKFTEEKTNTFDTAKSFFSRHLDIFKICYVMYKN